MKVKNCPKCGSIKFIKMGFYKNKNTKKQKYLCNDCKTIFQLKVEMPNWVNKAYNDYVFKNIILKDLSVKYDKSIKTIIKYFDLLNLKKTLNNEDKSNENKNENKNKESINLIFDGTFFKKRRRSISI
jgi:hypothetical protein